MRSGRIIAAVLGVALSMTVVAAGEPEATPPRHTGFAIAGTVRSADGQPLPGVSVTLRASDGRVVRVMPTVRDGSYRLEGLQPASYALVFELAGFAPVERTAAASDAATSSLDVTLDLLRYGQVVQVTSSRTEQKVEDSPASISVVSAERIAASPADNYADLLRGLPGMAVVQLSNRDVQLSPRSNTAVMAGGQLVVVDGRTVYLDQLNHVLWDTIPVGFDEVKQVEVLRGPGSAVWGANAILGVVNIRTKSPREMLGGDVKLGGGQNGVAEAGFRFADLVGDRWSYKVSGSYYRQDAYTPASALPSGEPFPPGITFHNEETKQPKLDLRVDYDHDPDTRLSLSGGGASTSGTIMSAIGPLEIPDTSRSMYARASLTRKGLEANLYVNHLNGAVIQEIGDVYYETDETVAHAEAIQRLAVGRRQALVFGGSLRHSAFHLGVAPAADGRELAGAFIEDQIYLGERLRLAIGSRLDWASEIGTNLSPRVSVLYKPAQGHALRFSYSRAYATPPVLYQDADMVLPLQIPLGPAQLLEVPVHVSGNPEIDVSTLNEFEIGLTSSLGSAATLTLVGYRDTFRDAMNIVTSEYFGPDDPPPGWPFPPAFVPPATIPKTVSAVNQGKVIRQGVELGLQWRLRRGWTLDSGYTWNDVPDVRDVDPSQAFLVNRPARHQASASLSYNGPRWLVSGDATYVGETFWGDVLDARFWGTAPAYTLFNAGVGLKLAGGRTTVQVRGTNLSNAQVRQHVLGDLITRRVVGTMHFGF